jgi:hypothetical protein
MLKRYLAAVLLLTLGLVGQASAQTPFTRTPGTIPGCTTNCTIANLNISTLNNWTPTFGVRMDTSSTPAAGGTGNAVGDALTLNAGCTTNPIVTVGTISGGAVTAYNITNPGNCLSLPTNPVSVLSSTGSGTGATFNLTWAPIAANVAFSNAELVANQGNFILGAQPGAFSGTESTFIGGLSPTIASGNFITDVGIGNCGIGSGTTLQNASFLWCVGSNAGRNLANGATTSMFAGTFGSSASPNITGANNYVFQIDGNPALTTGNNNAMFASSCNLLATGSGSVCIGYGSGLTTAAATNAVVIGGTPNTGQTTKGAECPSGSVCIGAQVGNTNITGSDYILMGLLAGNTTCGAGGIKTVLIGFGVDCMAANTSQWLNVDNAFLSSVHTPAIGSGFGTSPTISGASSAAFQVNVGTGGTASTGTVTFTTNAPTGWACAAVDDTNPATSDTVVTPLTSGSITLTNYVRTTGIAGAWAASDIITVTCNGF